MLKITIKDAQVEERTIKPQNGKQPFTVRSQRGLAAIGNEIRELQLRLPEGHPGYGEGSYTLSPKSLYVGSFGKLAVGDIHLDPAK